jgi:hypothetical protein
MPRPQLHVDGRLRWAKVKKRHLAWVVAKVGHALNEDESRKAANAASMLTHLDQLKEAIERGEATYNTGNQVVRLNHAVRDILDDLTGVRTPQHRPGRPTRYAPPKPSQVVIAPPNGRTHFEEHLRKRGVVS